jgi:hypothetical protein
MNKLNDLHAWIGVCTLGKPVPGTKAALLFLLLLLYAGCQAKGAAVSVGKAGLTVGSVRIVAGLSHPANEVTDNPVLRA